MKLHFHTQFNKESFTHRDCDQELLNKFVEGVLSNCTCFVTLGELLVYCKLLGQFLLSLRSGTRCVSSSMSY